MTYGRYWLLLCVPTALHGFAWGFLRPYTGMPFWAVLLASMVGGILWGAVCVYAWGPHSERAYRKGWYR